MTNNLLIENQYKQSTLFNKNNVNNLVRILTRFGTIPKIYSINIITSSVKPKLFKINPGKSITIGTDYLENPDVALVYLRYAIEWQVWFRAFKKDLKSSTLCDLAAIQTTLYFYDLLPIDDKKRLENSDYLLAKIIQKKENNSIENIKTNKPLLNKLQSFHKLKNSDEPFNASSISVIENLAKPIEYLLMSGGDFRLDIDEENLLNKYGCRPFPRPEAFTFASSTGTSVSNFAYDKAERARTVLIQKSLANGMKLATNEFSESLKTNLRDALKIKENCQIIFSPSGTDSSLQIAAITQIITDKKITHILLASDETGSGVPAALEGFHFENNTALSHPVIKGDRINGFRDVTLVKIPFRDTNGELKSTAQLDDEVYHAVIEAKKMDSFIVLHAMDQSKLGYQSPSNSLLEKIHQIENLSLQVIIDGSQLRLDPADIINYLDKGYIVTITGSKYFTGPPYAGALIVPNHVSDTISSINTMLPKGLKAYYNNVDWPSVWNCSNQLSNGFNYGTYMRWNAAISEMKRYYKTPILYRNLGIEMFCNFVRESIIESPFLEPLFVEESEISNYNNEEFGLRTIRTIFPFFILKNNIALEVEKVKKLYVLLNSDISMHFEGDSMEILRLAAQKCHIGQAVNVRHKSNKQSAILRISLGSRVISESWKDRDISMFFRNIEEQLSQVAFIIKKIELIVNHAHLLK